MRGYAAVRSPVLAAVGVLLAAPAALAQSPSPPAVPTFGVTTELVYLRFHVERKGAYLGDLTKEQILVFEDGKPQPIALLETPSTRERTIPPQVTLAIDVSGSVMDARLLDETLIREVFLSKLSDQTTVGLCAFGGELRCFAPPTRDFRTLARAFDETLLFARESRRTGTRLYASLAELTRPDPEAPKAQRALVVFSDGIDNRGGKVDEAVKAALEGDVRVYAVKLSQAYQATAPTMPGGASGPSGGFGSGGNRSMYDYRKFDLDKLAGETGGRAYEPATLDEKSVGEILRAIASEITMEMIVGYQPEGGPSGKRRKVKVELADKSLGKIKDGERTVLR